MVISWDLPVTEFGSGTKVESAVHRFLRNERRECLEDRARRIAECTEVERRDRCVASAVHKRRKQAAVVSRNAVQRTLRFCRWRIVLGQAGGRGCENAVDVFVHGMF